MINRNTDKKIRQKYITYSIQEMDAYFAGDAEPTVYEASKSVVLD
jgi:hypothetical protein